MSHFELKRLNVSQLVAEFTMILWRLGQVLRLCPLFICGLSVAGSATAASHEVDVRLGSSTQTHLSTNLPKSSEPLAPQLVREGGEKGKKSVQDLRGAHKESQKIGFSKATPLQLSHKVQVRASAHVPRRIMTSLRKNIAPDPPGLMSQSFFVLELQFSRGQLSIETVYSVKAPAPTVAPRYFGRFAIELYVGPTLLERKRFDVPLMSDDSDASDSFAKGLSTRLFVAIPDSDRPTRLEIVDRASDKRLVFDYPLRVDRTVRLFPYREPSQRADRP